MTEVKPNVFARFGNDLHSGKRSYPFIGKRQLWLMIAAALMAVSVIRPLVGNGFNVGIDFGDGSEFVVSKASHPESSTAVKIV